MIFCKAKSGGCHVNDDWRTFCGQLLTGANVTATLAVQARMLDSALHAARPKWLSSKPRVVAISGMALAALALLALAAPSPCSSARPHARLLRSGGAQPAHVRLLHNEEQQQNPQQHAWPDIKGMASFCGSWPWLTRTAPCKVTSSPTTTTVVANRMQPSTW